MKLLNDCGCALKTEQAVSADKLKVTPLNYSEDSLVGDICLEIRARSRRAQVGQ